jgi:hypothetical protein
MNRSKPVLVAASIVAALSAASYASPYWELYRLRSAVQQRDAAAVAAHVDFPALRASVKAGFTGMFGKLMARPEMAGNPAMGYLQSMAGALVERLVDQAVSPAGVIAMFEQGRAAPDKPEAARAATPSEGKLDYSLAYRGWGAFAVSVKGQDEGSFIFRRDGLWSWKLAAVEFPTQFTFTPD